MASQVLTASNNVCSCADGAVEARLDELVEALLVKDVSAAGDMERPGGRVQELRGTAGE